MRKLKQIRYNLMVKYQDSDLTEYHNLMSPYTFGVDYLSEDEMSEFNDATFEDMVVKIPVGSIACLERLYGDWQTEPPIEERRQHLN
jgi:phosphorylcholine metabolism protein LicD